MANNKTIQIKETNKNVNSNKKPTTVKQAKTEIASSKQTASLKANKPIPQKTSTKQTASKTVKGEKTKNEVQNLSKNERRISTTNQEKKNLTFLKKEEKTTPKVNSNFWNITAFDDFSKKEKWIYLAITFGIILVLTLVPILVSLSLSFPKKVYASDFPSASKVSYSAEYLGTTKRNPPSETHDGGLETGYPTYGYTKSLTTEQKNAIINESNSLCAVGTRISNNSSARNTYDAMDSQGNLYLNGIDTGKDLYKHTGAVGNYLGDVDNEEPGVIKRLTLKGRGYGYELTGLYAPAGEVIEIQMTEEELTKAGGLKVLIGQALYNHQANNIWSAKNINRMPVILNVMNVNGSTVTAKHEDGIYTFYVGSFLGGPIYLLPSHSTAKFTVTISGAVNYSHFILGYTTRQEFEQNAKSSAPYFDLMVWDGGVLHSGPKHYAKGFSYDELTEAAILWDKISLVSTQVSRNSTGIVFLYDPFVAAGAAVAFPGRHSVNCPASWMPNSLNYKTFVNSGAWGNIHEYNHNYQNWGISGYCDEVTNNSLSLVSYSLYTKISSNRRLGASGEGMGGWNRYTSASWSIGQVVGSRRENELSIYSSLLHSFGQTAFMNSAKRGYGGIDKYFTLFSENTHNDLSYFAELIGKTMSESAKTAMQSKNYSKFVPIASTYQTGRSYMYDNQKRYIETMQPYKIKYGEKFEVDLRPYTTNNDGFYQHGSIVLPTGDSGFSYKIKRITKPKFGKLNWVAENVYSYIPDHNNLRSGKIYVTLEITKNDDPTFKVDDVDLVLEFEQDHEMNKNMLTRTTYVYNSDKMYSSATEAFENHYAGYNSKTEGDNINSVQNGNAEVWGVQPTSNAIMEVFGKIYVDTAGDYRIALRGRHYAALYISLDNGKTYQLAVDMVNTTNNYNFIDGNENDSLLKNLKAGQWVYFKAVLLVTYERSFIGVGWGKFEPPAAVLDEEGNPEDFVEGEPTISVKYASAYRSNYEFSTQHFETDYFFKNNYLVSHTENYATKQTLVETNYEPWDNSKSIENLFDEDDTNHIHSANKKSISAENPFDLTVDLGETITVNRMTIYGEPTRKYQPYSFKIFGGLELNKLHLIKEVTAAPLNNNNVIVDFENQSIKFYRIIVTETYANKTGGGSANYNFIAFRCIKFTYTVSNGKQISPDNEILRYQGNWKTENVISTFGHIYSGKNTKVEFEFTGTHLGIFSYMSEQFKNYEVVIDDVKYSSKNITNSKETELSFFSPLLKNKKHKVVIRSKNNFNIDSIVYWS